MSTLYQTKYLKYKNKYFELKNSLKQIGGASLEPHLEQQKDKINSEYNYVKYLIDTYGNQVKKQLCHLICQMKDVIKIYQQGKTVHEINIILVNAFFKDKQAEYGMVGFPPGSTVNTTDKKPENHYVTALPPTITEEWIENFIQRAPIRVLMIMIKNFQAGEVNCWIYSIFLLYRSDPKTFEIKYGNIFNKDEIEKNIKFIEKYLDLDIMETNKCYKDFSLNSKADFTEISGAECTDDKRLYNKWGYKGYTNICSLWLPLTYITPFQSMYKLNVDKNNEFRILLGEVEKTTEPDKYDQATRKANCSNFFQKFPFLEPLIKEEIDYINSKSPDKKYILNPTTEEENKNNTDLLANIYGTISCTSKIKEPKSFYYSRRASYNNHYDLTQNSGHTVFFLMIGRYFKIPDIWMLLAQIIWTVPYNHSMYEVLSGAKSMDAFPSFKWENSYEDIKETINKMI